MCLKTSVASSDVTAHRPTVWVITPSIHREGGTERAVAEQLHHWRREFDLTLYTMDLRDVDTSGVRVRCLWRPPGPHLLRYVWWLLANQVVRWWDQMRYGRPDVVHSPGVNALRADAIGVHIVFSKHWARVRAAHQQPMSNTVGQLRSLHRRVYWALLRVLERHAYSASAQLWALSREDAGWLETLVDRPRGSIPVVAYGVDSLAFSPEARQQLRTAARRELYVEEYTVLLLVGNDWYKKGLDHAIRALATLPPTYIIAVAGRDDPEPFLRVAKELAIEERVRWWPVRSDVLTYYAAADCLLAPSREDAFHLPTLEAMACGLPAVVSKHVGATELFGPEGDAVMVVDHSDDPHALSAAIRETVQSEEATRCRVSRGLTLARARSWDQYSARTAALVRHNLATPRVLVLAPDVAGAGGIERFSRSLLQACVERYGAERVGVCSVWGSDFQPQAPACRRLWSGPSHETATSRRVTVWVRLKFALAAVHCAWAWRGPQLAVICTHAHLAPVAMMCRLVSGANCAVWAHGAEVWGYMRPSVRLALRRADTLVAAGQFMARELAQQLTIDPDRVFIVKYSVSPDVVLVSTVGGVDHPGATPTRDDSGATSEAVPRPRVLTVARLDHVDTYKGVDTLLLAWPQVLSSQPDAILVVVGDGDDRPRLQGLSRLLSIEPHVQFVGRLSDQELAAAYANASVFALPGRMRAGPSPQGEGFGLVFIEAAAAGVPCIAGRAGGAPEAIEDGVTGLLVNPESPIDVARGIVRLLADPVAARRMGDVGRSRVVREFSAEAFADRVAALVTTLQS